MRVGIQGGEKQKDLLQIKRYLPEDVELVPAKDESDDALIEACDGASALFSLRASTKVVENIDVKLIQVPAAGVDGIDLEKAKEKEILVANVGGILSTTVAEHVFALLLALSRKLIKGHLGLKERKWIDLQTTLLTGKTIGIVGFGNIGREVAKIARAFGMKVLAVKKHPKHSVDADLVVGPEDMREVLAKSDFVVVAVPLTKETRGFFSHNEFSSMKKTAYLINIARGPVIDEEALYKALKEKRIAGAGIDTWYIYPPNPNLPSNYPLWELDNIIMSPHAGGVWHETLEDRLKVSAENIIRLKEGKKLLNLINLDLQY